MTACATPAATTPAGSEPATTTTAPTPAPTDAPSVAPGAARVNLWHTIPAGATETYFNNTLVPTFAAAHPECVVVPRQLGVEDPKLIRTGLALDVNDPNRPNMWWLASSETGAYVEADVLADVDGWLASKPEIKDNIIPAVLDVSSYQGKVWSLPWMTNSTAMWINLDLFEQAGVPVPSQDPETTWTWEEFADAAAKLTSGDVKGFLVTTSSGWDFWTFHTWYASAGGDVSGLADLDSAAAVKAVQFQKDLLANGYATTTTTGWDPAAFFGQKVAIQANGPWNYSGLKELTFNWSIVPYPRDVKPAANLGGDQLYIAKSTPEQEACAFAFGEYMLSDEFQVGFQIASGNLPVTKSAAENADYQQWLADNPAWAGYVNQTPFGVARPPIPQFGQIGDPLFKEAWDDVLLNGADVTERLTKLQQDVDALLAQ
jgi:multiple sugar transport system substrate-binding protein